MRFALEDGGTAQFVRGRDDHANFLAHKAFIRRNRQGRRSLAAHVGPFTSDLLLPSVGGIRDITIIIGRGQTGRESTALFRITRHAQATVGLIVHVGNRLGRTFEHRRGTQCIGHRRHNANDLSYHALVTGNREFGAGLALDLDPLFAVEHLPLVGGL